MLDRPNLSDKALAVFAFAAYHQLESGQPVTKVIRSDGQGHEADGAAVEELQELRLATVAGNDIELTESGLAVLARSLDGLREAAAAGLAA